MPEAAFETTEPFEAHPFESLEGVFPSEGGGFARQRYEMGVKALQIQSFAKVERIRYRSGGFLVTGVMAAPVTVRKGSHPFIIYNRGGNREFGMWTAPTILRYLLPLSRRNDALVFATNYRGVDGGEGKDEFGGADLEDVLRLTEIARAHPGWDGVHSLMMGSSRGGMMVFQALKAGAAVNGGVTIAAPADMRGDLDSRPEMEEVYAETMPDYTARKDEHFFERSALCWPEALRVPLLLLHGDADARVPVTDSIRLSQALTALKRRHELVVYPGDDRFLTYNLEDALARVSEWLCVTAKRKRKKAAS